jgi:hypothetical protein
VDEIVAVMRHTPSDRHGYRLRAIIVVLRRARLRLPEVLALAEHELDARRGSLWVRRGKGGRRRQSACREQRRASLAARAELPAVRLFCIIDGRTRGRAWSAAAARTEFRRLAVRAGRVTSPTGPSQRPEVARARNGPTTPPMLTDRRTRLVRAGLWIWGFSARGHSVSSG